MKEKIIVTGSSGLIGTKLVADLEQQFELVGFDHSNPIMPVDIADIDSLKSAFEKHQDAKAVVHLAAYTDVTAAHMQAGDRDGSAYRINVDGSKNVALCAKEYGQHMIHMSTAYVFSGDKDAPYTEEDELSPIEWYGQTKAYAEQAVTSVGPKYTILRIDQPFRSDAFGKLDTVHRIIEGL
ncbi:MAG: NAD(P)-dependent oxidoreductase, partial [Pseudomonadales bacterium]|nr:NAD(P)-dependent oxidoreductase [Pseudomonadales bacterium]